MFYLIFNPGPVLLSILFRWLEVAGWGGCIQNSPFGNANHRSEAAPTQAAPTNGPVHEVDVISYAKTLLLLQRIIIEIQ